MDLGAANLDEFKASTAEIADDPFGAGKGGYDPKAGIARFLVGAEDLARKPYPFDLADELRSVAGVADGGRRDHLHLFHAHVFQKQAVALQGRQCLALAFGLKLTRFA